MNLVQAWEWLGVITALIYVYLASKGSRYCFIFGLLSSLIFVQICFSDRLYFDTSVNAYYVVMSVFGWFSWKSESGEISPRTIKNRTFLLLLLAGVLISIILGYGTHYYSDASLPFIDSFTTVLAVIATWMMVRKIIQSWIVWILVDTVSIFMYLYKEHYPIAALFLVYTVISFYGYYNWQKKLSSI